MPSTSEVGHAKNVANLQKLIEQVTVYTLYNPPVENLTVPNLTALYSTASVKLTEVEDKRNANKNSIALRQDAFADLKSKCTKIINHLEILGLPQGTIKATVLIETILATFEMEEILFELREHSAGLNAGRWDYIFSCIKKFKKNRNFCLANRSAITMEVPFMRAYALALIQACHKRGAPAMGGMSALIPIKNDQEANEKALAGIRHDADLTRDALIVDNQDTPTESTPENRMKPPIRERI